ncbi:hypothetical protein GCM10010439_68040 [Actinocorallia aurantiaca]|uniref:Uncharacterized protein n=1 Tax=Actinocorallia aurantiaca TaxID=46204 RepID=A0ABP6H6D7_9ACTN
MAAVIMPDRVSAVNTHTSFGRKALTAVTRILFASAGSRMSVQRWGAATAGAPPPATHNITVPAQSATRRRPRDTRSMIIRGS